MRTRVIVCALQAAAAATGNSVLLPSQTPWGKTDAKFRAHGWLGFSHGWSVVKQEWEQATQDIQAAAFTMADEGKTMSVKNDKVKVENKFRLVVWGDANHSDCVPTCTGTIRSVEKDKHGISKIGGIVQLHDGKRLLEFRNPLGTRGVKTWMMASDGHKKSGPYGGRCWRGDCRQGQNFVGKFYDPFGHELGAALKDRLSSFDRELYRNCTSDQNQCNGSISHWNRIKNSKERNFPRMFVNKKSFRNGIRVPIQDGFRTIDIANGDVTERSCADLGATYAHQHVEENSMLNNGQATENVCFRSCSDFYAEKLPIVNLEFGLPPDNSTRGFPQPFGVQYPLDTDQKGARGWDPHQQQPLKGNSVPFHAWIRSEIKYITE